MNDLPPETALDALSGERTHFPPRRLVAPPAPQPRSSEPPPPPTASPLLLLDTMRRHIISFCLVTLLAGLTGGALVQQVQLHYVATAALMVAEQKSALALSSAQASLLGGDSLVIRTQVDLLRGAELASRVAMALDLAHKPEFARALHRPPSLLDGLVIRALAALHLAWPDPPQVADTVQSAALLLRDKTTIVNDGRSYVIEIQVRTEDAALAATIANAYAEAYLAMKTQIKSEALRRANARLAAQLDSLAERANAAAHAVADYRARAGLVEDRVAATGVTVTGQQMAQLNAQLVAVSNERARLDTTLAQIRDAGGAAQASLPDILASPLIQRLAEQEAELAGREANMATTRGANDPGMMSLRAARAAIEHKISLEASRVVASISAAAAAAHAREAKLRDELNQVQSQVANEGKSSVRLIELQNAADAAHAVYTDVLNRSAQTANAIDLQEPDAVLVSPATLPLGPAFPAHKHLLLLDLIAAPICGLLFALLRDLQRPGLRSAEAIELLTGLPCLGFIPNRRGRRGARDFAEAVAGLPAMLGRKRPRVLLLTAALPGEGTSVLAEALARALAEAGARVLLVVCGRGFAPPSTPMPNLEIVTANPPMLPKAPRSRYDLILLDTPAVLVATLTLPLAAMAEATILVVRFGHTPAPLVARAVQLLRRHGGHPLGTVVTRVDRRQLSPRDGSERYLDRHRRRRSGFSFHMSKRPLLPRDRAPMR
jgi:uncharacterized protein involved in exopolysaccharide biosynthesis/Mrp family chromosome partitioning ATPase